MDGMEDQQDLLFAALKRSDWKDAKHILSAHPELINMRRKVWKDGFEIEDLTPLIEACRQDWQNIVKFLLDNGANAQATGYLHFETNVNCRLTRAISRETTANLGLFRGGFGALDGVFPLFAAGCVEARVTIIKKLLSAGADVNQRTAMGQTALHALCAARLLMNELREVSLDDGADDYAGHSFNNYKAVKIEALIKYGSDVNICDDLGKSPLHYAAKFGQNVIAKILIRNGANVFLKDKLGLTALEYAAVENRRLTMALIEKYAFPIERIILAYECVAIHHWDPIEPLRKATLLREQHGISKTVLPPFECYGFEKEWETVEELEKHAAECADGTLFLQCVLARERISVENGLDIAQEDREDVRRSLLDNERCVPKHLYNSLMRRQLDRCSFFRNYFHFIDFMIKGRSISLRCAINIHHVLSNDVIVQFVLVAIDSCCAIQRRLNTERKPGCLQELIGAISQTLVMIRALILHLIKRSDGNCYNDEMHASGYVLECESEVNHRMAKILLVELFHRCPMVLVPFSGYASPVANILFSCQHKLLIFTDLTARCLRYNFRFTKMVIDSQCDLNETDCQGNTLLHAVISDAVQEINILPEDCMAVLIDIALETIRMLLDNGSYPHAKNKQGKCPADSLQNVDVSRYDAADLITLLEDLLEKYDCTLTLKYLAAKKIVESKIPYANLLPKALAKFVDLH